MGDGNSVNFRPIVQSGVIRKDKAGVLKGLMNNWQDNFKMRASGNFWDNTAILGEDVNLGDNHVAENFLPILNNSGSGLVARSFDGENVHS